MKFARNDRRPAGLSRRLQWRLIGLILAFGFVLAAAEWAAQPQVWSWIVGQQPGLTAAPAAEPAAIAAPGADAISAAGYRGIVPESALEGVRDNALGFSRLEGAGLARIVDELASMQHRTIARASRRDVTFAVLMADAAQYRGQAVEVRGLLRRLTPLPQLPGEDGRQLLEGWVFGADADDRPYRVLSLAAADGLPRGEQFEGVPVRLDGVFYKRSAYASEGGPALAPLVVAKRIDAVSAPAAAASKGAAGTVLPTLVAAAVGCVFLAFVRTATGRRRRIAFSVGRGGERTASEDVDISAESPSEFLAGLSKNAREMPPAADSAPREAAEPGPITAAGSPAGP